MDLKLTPKFESLAFLFQCDNRNRGIIRMNFDEAALLWTMVRRTGGDVLEIGRFQGGSTVLLLLAAATRRVVSVDIAPRHHPFCDQVFEQAVQQGVLELLVADSRHALTGRRFGFALIDGDHSYEGVKADTAAHWPSIVAMDGKDPIVLFHDAVPNDGLKHDNAVNHAPGVLQYCQELVASGCAEALHTAGSMLAVRKCAELTPDLVAG